MNGERCLLRSRPQHLLRRLPPARKGRRRAGGFEWLALGLSVRADDERRAYLVCCALGHSCTRWYLIWIWTELIGKNFFIFRHFPLTGILQDTNVASVYDSQV